MIYGIDESPGRISTETAQGQVLVQDSNIYTCTVILLVLRDGRLCCIALQLLRSKVGSKEIIHRFPKEYKCISTSTLERTKVPRFFFLGDWIHVN